MEGQQNQLTTKQRLRNCKSFERTQTVREANFQMAPHDTVIRMRHRFLIIGSCATMYHRTETPIETTGRTHNSPKGCIAA